MRKYNLIVDDDLSIKIIGDDIHPVTFDSGTDVSERVVETIDNSKLDRVKGIERVPGDVKYTVQFNHKEFCVIKALLQNPHPYYQANEETTTVAEKLFNDLKDVM